MIPGADFLREGLGEAPFPGMSRPVGIDFEIGAEPLPNFACIFSEEDLSRGFTDTSSRKPAMIVPEDFTLTKIYDRVWLRPELIDCGIILDDIHTFLNLWNAWLDRSVTVEGIEELRPEGTFLDHQEPPFPLGTNEEISVPLTIYREGPAVQDTAFVFTVEGLELRSRVLGTRVLLIPSEPEWDEPVSLTLNFQTVIAQGRKLSEQRRPLLLEPYRQESFTVTAFGLNAQKIHNLLAYAKDKVVGVPIYSEPLQPAGSITGQTEIEILNDASKYWNLNNLCEFIAVLETETMTGEIVALVSIVGQTLTVGRAISGAYADPVLYPMFPGLITGVKERSLVDGIDAVEIQVEEYLRG
ncbi:hypothetical protein [Desulfatiglans anilini]|uniref:hypothetical protein n=1 Tax=Desulfatiglans anilini TaxID=90728 RepID=UPI00040AFCCC|nr:hypothetical protein [Desulfatiglans anilini]